MSSSDSVFLFEISLLRLKSFKRLAKDWYVQARFTDVFMMQFKDPNNYVQEAFKKHRTRLKSMHKHLLIPAQSVMVAMDITTLLNKMKTCPIELFVCSRDDPCIRGIVEIPWPVVFTSYLQNLQNNIQTPPPVLVNDYKTYNDYNSKQIANLRLKIKLSQLIGNAPLRANFGQHPMSNSPQNKDSDEKVSFYVGGKRKPKDRNRIFSLIDDQKTSENATDAKSNVNERREGFHPVSPSTTHYARSSVGSPTGFHSYFTTNDARSTARELSFLGEEFLRPTAGTTHDVRPIVTETEECLEGESLFPSTIGGINNSSNDTACERTNVVNESLFTLINAGSYLTSRDISDENRVKNASVVNTDAKAPYLIRTEHSNVEIRPPTTSRDPYWPHSQFDAKYRGKIRQIISFDTINRNIPFKRHGLVKLTRSETQLQPPKKKISKSLRWSTTSLDIKQEMNFISYIFGNVDLRLRNQVYCVGYANIKGETSKSRPPVQTPSYSQNPNKAQDTQPNFIYHPCSSACVLNNSKDLCTSDICAKDIAASKKIYFPVCDENICHQPMLPEALLAVETRKCSNLVECTNAYRPMVMQDPPRPILLSMDPTHVKDCCIEHKVTGNISAKMTHGDDPCLCTCECTFGFVTQTTYCAICGGYEVAGDKVEGTEGRLPFPCPIYHKLNKAKSKKKDETAMSDKSRGRYTPANESGKDLNTKKVIDERFKFNYGYKGIPPQIGHSQCAMPCTGHMRNVPKHMGWLWTADNVPGLKYRPGWKPGAANKYVVRLLRIARYPGEVSKKKKKKDDGKTKRPLKRPLLTVEKKDGEFFVSIEHMKQYAKPRLINQPAFEDKDPLMYKVGRTDEENLARAKRKARAQRRLMAEKRAFIQSTFHDMCKDICYRTYQQALGQLPFDEDPLCPCFTLEPPLDIDSHSCSCSDSKKDTESSSDDGEWKIEFTPPCAYYNPADRTKRVFKNDVETQYSYLDYRVKLTDRFGNPVPRFFIGPNGKKECSDLGGFWGPDGKWLQINVDGVVGPDGRWAPNNFTGPCGEPVEAENGKFQATNGVWLLIGVDGYVDCHGQWHFYPENKMPKTVEDPKNKTKNNIQMSVNAWLKEGACNPKEETIETSTNVRGRRKFARGIHNCLSGLDWSCFVSRSRKVPSGMRMGAQGDARRQQSTLPRRHTRRESPELQKSKLSTINSSSLGTYASSRRRRKAVKDDPLARAKERLKALEGISLSSYHVPCLRSFINSEEAQKMKVQHILNHNARVMANMATQIG